MNSDHITVEQMMEGVYGEHWKDHPEYLRARAWVMETFYPERFTQGIPMNSEREIELYRAAIKEIADTVSYADLRHLSDPTQDLLIKATTQRPLDTDNRRESK